MPLQDAVGINCKKGATTENQGASVSIWAKGYMLMIACVFRLNMTTPPWWREKVMVYYYYYYYNSNIKLFCIIIMVFRLIALPNKKSEYQYSEVSRFHSALTIKNMELFSFP